jgi:hypothetical protein
MLIEAYLIVLNVLNRFRFQPPEDGEIISPETCRSYGTDSARELQNTAFFWCYPSYLISRRATQIIYTNVHFTLFIIFIK